MMLNVKHLYWAIHRLETRRISLRAPSLERPYVFNYAWPVSVDKNGSLMDVPWRCYRRHMQKTHFFPNLSLVLLPGINTSSRAAFCMVLIVCHSPNCLLSTQPIDLESSAIGEPRGLMNNSHCSVIPFSPQSLQIGSSPIVRPGLQGRFQYVYDSSRALSPGNKRHFWSG
jgi:hypothetical protein